jgi:hypothetical protein
MRVVTGRHGSATYRWADAKMSLATSLAQLDVAVIQVPHLADCGIAALTDQAYFTGGKAHLSVIAFFRQELGGSTCCPDQLGAFPLLKLDVVHQRADWNIRNGQAVAGANFCLGTRHH